MDTVPENDNLNEEIIQWAGGEAINLGADYCFLEASKSGLSVYQKLGFKPLFKNNYYSYTRSE